MQQGFAGTWEQLDEYLAKVRIKSIDIEANI
jgi:hypothetical protein